MSKVESRKERSKEEKGSELEEHYAVFGRIGAIEIWSQKIRAKLSQVLSGNQRKPKTSERGILL